MRSFPHESQLDSKDCGPGCIKIVAKHYGKYFSLKFLRDLCGITKEGVTLNDISFACEQIGLRTICFKISWEKFIRMPLPCIVHWKNNHFIVVYKLTNRSVFVSDPAIGLLKYSHSDFRDGWLGSDNAWAVMALEPMADFKQRVIGEKRDKRKTIHNLLNYLMPYRTSILNLLLVMLIVTAIQAVLPFISKSIVDVGVQTGDIPFLNMMIVGNVAVIVSTLLSNMVRDWILLHLTSRLNISLISDYLIKLMKLPITFFEEKLVGDILQRANDHERIRAFLINNSLSFLFSALTFLVFSFILLYFNYSLAILYFIGSACFIVWVIFFLRWRKKIDWEYFDLNSKNQSFWVETLGGMADIKVNNYEKQKRWKWEEIQARMFKLNQRIMVINNAQNLGAQFINQLTNVLLVYICAKSVIQGQMTFGVMISVQFIIGMLTAPILQFVAFVQSYQSAKISFLRLNEIHQLEEEEESKDLSNSIDLPTQKDIFLNNVSFTYSLNTPLILKNISLQIPQGKVTAIVGDSGSGKTTLLKLILRLYKPVYGNITIGNLNIENLSLHQWRNSCGAVLQDGKIFNSTILNNIVLDDENVDYKRLQNAVVASNISKEVEAMPNGYQTLMGEMGRGLSGGQKQRVLIARALYKDPEYLFFDEATNALDTINERKIVESLDEVFKGKTVVVIAHRLSTIQKADQIVVLNKGMVIQVGDHETLMRNQLGHYYQLVKTQMGEARNGN